MGPGTEVPSGCTPNPERKRAPLLATSRGGGRAVTALGHRGRGRDGEDRRPAAVRAFIFRHPHRPEHGEES